MRSTRLLLTFLCTTTILAQFSIDKAKGLSAINNVRAYVTSLNLNPFWTSNIALLSSSLPPSIASLVSSDAQSFVELLATQTTSPPYLASIPPGVVSTLTSLASAPLSAVADIEAYLRSLYDDEATRGGLEEVLGDVPDAVREAAVADPIGWLAGLVAASTYPAWVSGIPASLQPEVASAIDRALAIVAIDVPLPAAASAEVTVTGTGGAGGGVVMATAAPGGGTGTGTGGVVAPTGTGAMSVSGTGSSVGATGSPISFVGAAPAVGITGATVVGLMGFWMGVCNW